MAEQHDGSDQGAQAQRETWLLRAIRTKQRSRERKKPAAAIELLNRIAGA